MFVLPLLLAWSQSTTQLTTQPPPRPTPVPLLPVPGDSARQGANPVAYTTPPSGDTVGYWQQRADYSIVGVLDEGQGVLRSAATLVYSNQSPDTLREFYVHQYLNAFRPQSAWSKTDEANKRQRFQNLKDPHYAYERFTGAPTFDGVPVQPEYPEAPDSTVVRFQLPKPLAPGQNMVVRFTWDARPSTLPRRQGRKGRSFDFAQWYPKVAVYNRKGWQPHALRPNGELYGEFGNFDVSIVLRDDQVVGSTGVVADGDPGWARVNRGTLAPYIGKPYDGIAPAPTVTLAPGYRRVRFVARNVHHFAWTTSPDYIYEGGLYVRGKQNAAKVPFALHDTVPLHVLYRPGDDTTWGRGAVLRNMVTAMEWLETIYGPYGYPQVTNAHRVENSGGTEFPMLVMNARPDLSLILHEIGHIYTYGLLANNEWQEPWLDEPITTYQTNWALRTMRLPVGTRNDTIPQMPVGRPADEYPNTDIYGKVVYRRGEKMYAALHELMGDQAFRRLLREYYARWAFKHVDEPAFVRTAEEVAGRSLTSFFNSWLRGE